MDPQPSEYARLQEEESAHVGGGAPSPAPLAQTGLSASVADKLRRARLLGNSLRARGLRKDETSGKLDALMRRAERANASPRSDDVSSSPGTVRGLIGGAQSRATPAPAAHAQLNVSAGRAAVGDGPPSSVLGGAQSRAAPAAHAQLNVSAGRAAVGDKLPSSPARPWSRPGEDASRVKHAAAPPSALEVLTYRLDLFLSRSSSQYLLLLIMLAVGLAMGTIALYPFVMGGELDGGGYGGDKGRGALRAVPRALWLTWSFMVDPGTHADMLDGHSAVAQLIGVGVACLGILIASTVVALVVDAVHYKVAALTAGSLHVPESGHVLVLGWSARAVSLLVELCEANSSSGGGVIVVISDARSKLEMEDESSFALDAERLKGTRILFRHGVPHLMPTLNSVRAHAAKAIVVLADPAVPAGVSDAATLRTVLSLRSLACPLQGHVVAEVNLVDCETALDLVGAALVDTVVADTILGRLLVVCSQNAGLAACYESLLGFFDNELYLKEWPQLVGLTFGEVARRFEHAVVVGVRHARVEADSSRRAERENAFGAYHGSRVSINTPDAYVLQPGDEIVVIAQDDNSYAPSAVAEPLPAQVPSLSPPLVEQPQQLLIIGWRPSLSAMLQNLAELVMPGSVVHVLAEEPLDERNSASLDIHLEPIEADGVQSFGRLTAVHHVGSPIKRYHLSRLPVECCDSILILASGASDLRSASGTLQSDSASLASLLLCWDVASAARERQQRGAGPSPSSALRARAPLSGAACALSEPFAPKRTQDEQHILCEILDIRTRDILHQDASVVSRFDFLLSNSVMSKVLAMVAEERAIHHILLELLHPAGSEMLVRPYAEYEPELRGLAEGLSFWDLSFFVRRRGEILVGYKRARAMPIFNPPDKRAPLRLTRADSLVVFSRAADTDTGQHSC